jgi:uncharacterized protein GlcG (DUF336 family)
VADRRRHSRLWRQHRDVAPARRLTALGHRHRRRQGAHGLVLRPTKLLDEVVSGGGAGMRYLALKEFVPLEGGIPIVVDGKIVGAIGVSGVSSQDTQVARAGIDALAK